MEGTDGPAVTRHGVVGEMSSYHAPELVPLVGDGQMPTLLELVVDLLELAVSRFEMVWRLSQKLPFLPFPQMCLKPKKSKISGLQAPFCSSSDGEPPNSISR